jgi:hypothetical protein
MRDSDGNDDGGNGTSIGNGASIDNQQQEGEESMIGAISCDNQVVDMTDWDFSQAETRRT